MNKRSKTDWNHVDAMSEAEVLRNAREDPDAQPTDAAFWADAEVVDLPARKRPVHIRLNPDVVEWFKRLGPGYQTRINQVLETYVAHQEGRKRRTGT